MTTRTISGQFADPNSGGVNGATITIWADSRFSGDPAFEDAPPSGSADFTVNAGVSFGKPGGWRVDVDASTDYWVLDTYNGHNYWTFNEATGTAAAEAYADQTAFNNSLIFGGD